MNSSLKAWELETPVAFLIFNRPDVTSRVFTEIAKARPRQLLIVSDGPRPERAGEADQVQLARSVVTNVDWDCEVLTNFSNENLGCKRRISSGLDWVFSQVDRAIVLEDDCLPTPTFFSFCSELLKRYANDQRISHINGSNFVPPSRSKAESYRFSYFNFVWGWAGWSDRWRSDYDVDMTRWPAFKEFSGACWHCSAMTKNILSAVFDSVYAGRVDTWDYQWSFAARANSRLSIVPNVNLISNIGFGAAATHTKNSSDVLSEIPTGEMVFPLTHPASVFADGAADGEYARRFINGSRTRYYLSRLFQKTRRLVR